MIPSAHLAALLELVDEYRDNPDVPADRLLQRYVKERRFIGSKDRQEISGQFFGFLRYQRRIAWHLQMAGVLHPTARDILIAYHILSTKMAEQTLETLFSGERYAPPKLERDELKLLRALKQQLGDESLAVPLGVQGECPDELLPSLQQQFGERLATELNALQRSAPLDLRANTLKATQQEVMESLLHSGVNAEA
jgi:16S rRNA (cytosine967-C5)-methyltransferase